MKHIYFDNNASTQIDNRVIDEIVRVLSANPGNPSALHAFGREQRRIIESARTRISGHLGVIPSEIIFVSGATEANNLALLTLGRNAPAEKRQILVSPSEHPSVLKPCRSLEKEGFELIWLPLDSHGVLLIDQAKELLTSQVAFASLMWVNNETGTTQPIHEWGRACEEAEIPLHCDAVQAVGRIPIDLGEFPVTYLTMSAHKFHGPQGIGALYSCQNAILSPMILGGDQEREKRAGTEAVALISGMAKALDLAVEEMDHRLLCIAELSKKILQGLEEKKVPFMVNGDTKSKWPGTLNLRLQGQSGEILLMKLDLKGIAVSVGSACSSGSLEPSHVLAAMGLSLDENLSSIRVSLSHRNSKAEVDRLISALEEIAIKGQ